jgi:tetratricopeptide (TPR) repeat protein
MGKTYLNIKKFDQALKELNKSIELDKNMGEAHLQIGILYAQTGKKDDAIKTLKYCISNFPEISREASFQLDLIENKAVTSEYYEKIMEINKCLNLCQYDDALKACNELIAADKNCIDGYLLRSQAYFYKNNFDKSSDDLKQALLLEPDNVGVHVNLAFVSLAQDDFNYAIELSNRAITMLPTASDAYLVRGTAYFKLNQKSKAKDDLLKYIELAPDGKYLKDARGLLNKISK